MLDSGEHSHVVSRHYRNTRYDYRRGALLSGTGPPPTAAVRGFARFLCRGRLLRRGRAALRLPARFVPSAVLAFPASDGPRLLPRRPSRSPSAAKEGRSTRAHRGTAQAQPVGLRHPRRTRALGQGAAQCNGHPGGASRGGLCSTAAARRRRAPGSPPQAQWHSFKGSTPFV